MKERLVELVDKAKKEYANDVTDHTETEYIVETLLNEGCIYPPCKVGEVVWLNTKFGTLKARVTEITQTINNNFLVHIIYDLMYCYKQHINTRSYVGYVEDKFEFGKTVFRTKEEAEAKLKERKED